VATLVSEVAKMMPQPADVPITDSKIAAMVRRLLTPESAGLYPQIKGVTFNCEMVFSLLTGDLPAALSSQLSQHHAEGYYQAG
jgi:hypothetical protein